MTDIPVEMIVAAFQDENEAENVLKGLKEAKHEGLIGIKDAAVITRDQKNKVHIKDIHDIGTRGGTALGALVGTGIALMTGGVGIVLSGAAGALVGRLAAKKIDLGIEDARLQKIADALQPGTSAILAFIEHKWVAEMEKAFIDNGAEVMRAALNADIAAQLEAGHDVAYSLISDESGIDIERVAGDESVIEIDSVQISEDGISAEATIAKEGSVHTRGVEFSEGWLHFTDVVETNEGVTAESVVVTDDEIVYEQSTTVADSEENADGNSSEESKE